MADHYEDDPEYDELLRSSGHAARVMADRFERWTRLQSWDGRLTLHCPIPQIAAVARQQINEQEAETLKIGDGDQVVVVVAAGHRILVARFDPDEEAAAEEYVAQFLALRGLDRS